MKLALSYTDVINGKFTLGSINLMMVFQVNCPGCFIHGFPLLKELQAHYNNKLSCFALATVFEDFHLNTEEHVRLLVNTGGLIGETLRSQEAVHLNWDSSTLSVPVLIDEFVNQSELNQSEFVNRIIQNMVDPNITTALEQENMRATLKNYFSQLPKCGKTFAENLMRGTPSFFLFTDSMDILVQWFGHADSSAIKNNLDIFINKKMGKSPFDLKHQNENIDSRIIAAMERISQAFRVLLWNESKELSLSPIQIQILIFLMFHSEAKRKVSYLAEEFNMTKATISDSIKVLEQKKFIRKEYEPHDTRSYIIYLTTKGLEIAKRTASFTNQIQEPIARLLAEDKENLLISLMSIIQHLNKTGVITIQRMCKTCVHFSPGSGKTQHFCNLLNQKLLDRDLRIDCPEHAFIVK